ncbi:hypothetical protein [Hymenobacter cellulosivorans]|uniref:Uncharacterized protein n=1 Tax=Hymenobacter cellulosivorans TaxID=2932249 RepID=A0ABY4F8A5_9BACT|nr:hypothetical protein [Hymenobacter cellulosivorans]UOQ50696.1 hypothetical protein MUN80_13095 [Hymenobacter cellulosivorans]
MNPDRQEAYYNYLDKQQKHEDQERHRAVNDGDDLSDEETPDSILKDMYPNQNQDEEIEFDNYD